MHDKNYVSRWYNDSGCLCYMIGRKSQLREFHSLKDVGRVKYGNNTTGEIKGYGMIINREFTIRKVAYVEDLQHNLMCIS